MRGGMVRKGKGALVGEHLACVDSVDLYDDVLSVPRPTLRQACTHWPTARDAVRSLLAHSACEAVDACLECGGRARAEGAACLKQYEVCAVGIAHVACER